MRVRLAIQCGWFFLGLVSLSATKLERKNEREQRSFFLCLGLRSVVKAPDNLCKKEVKILSLHTSNTAHGTFQDSPEALNAVGMNRSSDVFASVVVNGLMKVPGWSKDSVSGESIGVDASMRLCMFLNAFQDMGSIKLLWHHFRKDFAAKAIENAEYREFSGTMASFWWVALAYMKTLVLALATNVGLIHFNRA